MDKTSSKSASFFRRTCCVEKLTSVHNTSQSQTLRWSRGRAHAQAEVRWWFLRSPQGATEITDDRFLTFSSQGRQTGVFRSWPECEAQVSGYTAAVFKRFDTLQVAQKSLRSLTHHRRRSPSFSADVQLPLVPVITLTSQITCAALLHPLPKDTIL